MGAEAVGHVEWKRQKNEEKEKIISCPLVPFSPVAQQTREHKEHKPQGDTEVQIYTPDNAPQKEQINPGRIYGLATLTCRGFLVF